MSEQAAAAYRCPDEGDDRHVYSYRSTGVEGLGFVGVCMVCQALDVDELRRYILEAEQQGREDAARDVEALRNRWNGQHDVVQLTAAVAAARGEKP